MGFYFSPQVRDQGGMVAIPVEGFGAQTVTISYMRKQRETVVLRGTPGKHKPIPETYLCNQASFPKGSTISQNTSTSWESALHT